MRKRYTEEQIIKILQDVNSGKTISSVSREYGVSQNTIHRWRSRYGDIDRQQLRRLRELETENSRLKHIVADQVIDNHVLKELLGKYS